VLGQIDLHGKLVTADALHTVKATAEFICEAGGEFVLPVKENAMVGRRAAGPSPRS
jgi:predicted transposase YbfD/YdcC